MAGDPCGSGFGPLGPATPAGTFYPPPKSMGQLLGYQKLSGAVLRKRSPSWASLEAEASSGHDKESWALTGWTRLKKHVSMGHGTTLLAMICGLESAVAGWLEWASDGGVNEWTVDGGVDFLADGGLEGAAASGFGIPADGGLESAVDGSVLEGAAASGFGIPADGGLESAVDGGVLEGAVDGGRLAWIAAYSLLRSGLLSRCTQRGGTRNTNTRSKLKITVFNINKAEQDKADTDTETDTDTDRNTGSNE